MRACVCVCFYKLRMFLFDQYDHQSITAHIITARFGHVTLKPQPEPPFWVFPPFRSLSACFQHSFAVIWAWRCARPTSCVPLSIQFICPTVLEFDTVFTSAPPSPQPLTSALWPSNPQSSVLWFLVKSVCDQAALCAAARRNTSA